MNNSESFNWLKPTLGALAFGVVMYAEIYVLEKTGNYIAVSMASILCAAIAFILIWRADGWTSPGKLGLYIFGISSVLFSVGCVITVLTAR